MNRTPPFEKKKKNGLNIHFQHAFHNESSNKAYHKVSLPEKASYICVSIPMNKTLRKNTLILKEKDKKREIHLQMYMLCK